MNMFMNMFKMKGICKQVMNTMNTAVYKQFMQHERVYEQNLNM